MFNATHRVVVFMTLMYIYLQLNIFKTFAGWNEVVVLRSLYGKQTKNSVYIKFSF